MSSCPDGLPCLGDASLKRGQQALRLLRMRGAPPPPAVGGVADSPSHSPCTPQERLTCKEAMAHPYFDPVRSKVPPTETATSAAPAAAPAGA